MFKRFVLLALLFSVSACGRTQIIPENARTQTYELRVDHIMKRLVNVLEIREQQRGFQYVIWDADDTNGFPPVIINTTWRKVYIHSMILSLSDDLLALIIGHELGHVVEPGVPRPLLLIGSLGGSAGSGVLVGTLSQWYWGLLTGSGVGLLLIPPIILVASRSDESDSDEFGLRIMTKAGFNPLIAVTEMCELFFRVEPYQNEITHDGFGTHPNAKRRCENLKRDYERLNSN